MKKFLQYSASVIVIIISICSIPIVYFTFAGIGEVYSVIFKDECYTFTTCVLIGMAVVAAALIGLSIVGGLLSMVLLFIVFVSAKLFDCVMTLSEEGCSIV